MTSKFNGSDYVPSRDDKRLTSQHESIKTLMLDGEWRTLADIAEETDQPPASISAQLRHLRKQRFGGYLVEKMHLSAGLWAYRVKKGNG